MKSLATNQSRRYSELLKNLCLFEGYSQEDIAQLLRTPGIALTRIAYGERMLPSTGYTPQLGILIKGRAVVEKAGYEPPLRMGELLPGALFGMATLFQRENLPPLPTRITALQNAAALLFPEQVFRELLHRDFRLAENYMRYLTGRIYFLNSRIEELTRPDVSARVLLYLKQHAVDGRLAHSLTELAQSLSISRATLYRALNMLESGGEITRQGRNILLRQATKPDLN